MSRDQLSQKCKIGFCLRKFICSLGVRLELDLYETFHTKVRSTTTPVVSVTTTKTDTTSITASDITDTFSTTVTATSTETDTFTETDTATSTIASTTTTTPVASVSAGPYFTALLSEPEVAQFERRRRRKRNPEKYDFQNFEERSKSAVQPLGRNVDGSKQCPAQYPQSVECLKIVEKVVVHSTTITKSNTFTASTATNTITDTTTTTSTIVPADVSTTVTDSTSTTVTTTTTETTTTTSTETDTSTVAAPTATSYAQCESNNVVAHLGPDSFISFFGAAGYSSSTASSALECCQACALAGDVCTNFGFVGDACYFATGPATCSGNEGYTVVTNSRDNGGLLGYTIGNGNCGLTDAIS